MADQPDHDAVPQWAYPTIPPSKGLAGMHIQWNEDAAPAAVPVPQPDSISEQIELDLLADLLDEGLPNGRGDIGRIDLVGAAEHILCHGFAAQAVPQPEHEDSNCDGSCLADATIPRVPQGTEDTDYREQIERAIRGAHEWMYPGMDHSPVTGCVLDAVSLVPHPDTAEAARLRTDLAELERQRTQWWDQVSWVGADGGEGQPQ